MTTDKSELFIYYWRILGDAPIPEPEYRFHPTRKWRFDWAWPDKKVAVEVDGNAWGVKGGGRHGTDKDREKMNAAVELGWSVLRYSPQQIERDPDKICRQVKEVLGWASIKAGE